MLLVPIVLFVPVKGIDLRHFCIGQRKVIQLCIFLDMVWVARTGNNHHTLLQVPAENYLGRGYAMIFRNCGDYFITQQFRRVAPAAKGIPALYHDTEVLDIRNHVIFLVVGL